ncbi:Acg family FMN-binding oxidoreductase [Umezawaea sp.]|uniref:Acg family FMN-binding oxidoreductase n=1 Tax=Umezawaea sp. TaxID=1955258 RepID=UPI002ED39230
MDRGTPDETTVRAAVTMACRAPSVHNSQPWRWRFGPEGLHLFADPSRHLPAVDPTGADLLLSCGAALHHARIAFAATGWRATVHRLPDPDRPDHLAVVELSRHDPNEVEVAMAKAITFRRTDRRRFSSWRIPPALLAQLADRARAEGVIAGDVADDKARYELVMAIIRAAEAQNADPEYALELRTWSDVGARSVEGVPAANIPAGDVWYGDVRTRTFPSGELRQPGGAEVDDEGSLVVLGTTSDDRMSCLRAGEATSAVLLEATAAGLATCPLTQPLEVAETRELLRTEVLGGATYPQMVLRIGWGLMNAAPLPPTPRRPLDDVLDPPTG